MRRSALQMGWLITALCIPGFVLLYPATYFYNRRIPLLPTPIDFVEQNPFAVIFNLVASDLLQLTPVFEQFVKQILALVAILRPKIPLRFRCQQRVLAFVLVFF